MANNVIILGAGFSRDAGIPLLSEFVDTMLDLAMRQSCRGKKLSKEDCDIFTAAAKVRRELDGYHGRANFDDRNLEDILSILSFNALSGSDEAKGHVTAMNRAITRTIELMCLVKHPGIPADQQYVTVTQGPDLYRDFWKALLKWNAAGNELPTIITFNYDIVLERALLQTLIGTHYDGSGGLRFHDVRVKYFYPHVPADMYSMRYTAFDHRSERGFQRIPGCVMERSASVGSDSLLEIELLKLHGSVNFPTSSATLPFNIAAAVDAPFILPPIFNKMSTSSPTEMWKMALQRLGEAKNIVFVGYSLPATDIYMQYFLKAALGPNFDLSRIHIFDPLLTGKTDAADSMKQRYQTCFSQQLRSRINFLPGRQGTAQEFVDILGSEPQALFF